MARKNNNDWFESNTARDPKRLVKDMRSEADRREIPWKESWNGSHNITRFSASDDTRAGMVVVPMSERQVAKGTWGSIKRTLTGIGLLTIMFIILIALVV